MEVNDFVLKLISVSLRGLAEQVQTSFRYAATPTYLSQLFPTLEFGTYLGRIFILVWAWQITAGQLPHAKYPTPPAEYFLFVRVSSFLFFNYFAQSYTLPSFTLNPPCFIFVAVLSEHGHIYRILHFVEYRRIFFQIQAVVWMSHTANIQCGCHTLNHC